MHFFFFFYQLCCFVTQFLHLNSYSNSLAHLSWAYTPGALHQLIFNTATSRSHDLNSAAMPIPLRAERNVIAMAHEALRPRARRALASLCRCSQARDVPQQATCVLTSGFCIVVPCV